MMSLMVVPLDKLRSLSHHPGSNDTVIYSLDCVSPQWSSDEYERPLSFKLEKDTHQRLPQTLFQE
jgi:hypothetical protein